MNPCNCDRCMKKTPSDGFWHAPNASHARAAEEARELDYWMESRIGYDPKRGDPTLDNFTERQRSPDDLKRLLASTRKRYGR